jgi:hypothetical protein
MAFDEPTELLVVGGRASCACMQLALLSGSLGDIT